VAPLWEQSIAGLNDSTEPVIDLSQVLHVDGAGLALVIEWIRWARGHGRRLSFIEVPEKLMALARISEVDGFLDGASRKS
jgi:phospholipid transport system transporter-binding protein